MKAPAVHRDAASPTPAAQRSTARTSVAEPRRRAFLHLTLWERLAVFAWSVVWHGLFRWSPPFMNGWRILLLRVFGVTFPGRGRAFVSPSVRIDFPWNLELHDGVSIAHKVIINCMGKVTIGEGTRISQYSHICAGTHDYGRSDMQIVRRDISIGARVWIAADVFVGPGVSVGDGAILAARSSAFKDLPAGQVCVGEPARAIKARQGSTIARPAEVPGPCA